jgi:putative transposase
VQDRDGVYGENFRRQLELMDIQEILAAPSSPWQNAYAERLFGSIRRECLDHVTVLNESSLRRVLKSYFDYCHQSREHLSLAKDAPEPRAIQTPALGAVHRLPQVGGLHHRYERRAA